MACGQGGLEPAQDRVGPTRGQRWQFPGAQPMSKPTLDSIATARAKLEEELRNLERQEVQLRQQQEAFIARGLASRERARQAERYFDADEVLAGLGTQLADARKRGRRP